MRKIVQFILISLLSKSDFVIAMDLMQAWDLALKTDPQYQSMRYAVDSASENIEIVKATLLPNMKLNMSVNRSNTDQSYIGSNLTSSKNSNTNNYSYTAQQGALSISQPLLRMTNYYQFKVNQENYLAASQNLNSEFQLLAVRLATAYFDTVFARERYENILNRTSFYKSSLTLAEKAFDKGSGTKTDIEDARSRLDAALADELEAKYAITVAEITLAAIVGEKVSASELFTLSSGNLALEEIMKLNLDDWLLLAQKNNPNLASLTHKLNAAEKEIDKVRANHLPTVDLVGNASYSESASDNTIGYKYNTVSLGVQVTVPLYSGGGVEASVNQARDEREKIFYENQNAQKKINIEVSKQYSLLHQGVARIRALEQALKSSKEAIRGNQKGVQAGTRNIVDVMNAQHQSYLAQTNLTEAKYGYILAHLRLNLAAGSLLVNDLKTINSWLVKVE